MATKKTGAKNLQNLKMISLGILSIVKPFYSGKSLNRIRQDIAVNFENQIETVFKLLNLNASADLACS
ncbi:hypothetical protein FACS189465_3290 [Clostridia bacterium]|nr:hypothetical protein FACS189465_3290 [Clostridia bacterium]